MAGGLLQPHWHVMGCFVTVLLGSHGYSLPLPQLGLFILYVGGLNSWKTRKFLGANHAFACRLVALPELDFITISSLIVNNLKNMLWV